MRYKIIPLHKPTTEADLRLARMSKDGFRELGDAVSAIETSFPNARYITPFSALDYFISRGWKSCVYVIRPDGVSPETRQYSIAIVDEIKKSPRERESFYCLN